jgi:hypothetical protein
VEEFDSSREGGRVHDLGLTLNTETTSFPQPFEKEAEALSAERRAAYDKWRANLTLGDVRIINEYRSKTKNSKLGRPPSSTLSLS